jgi:hypothetical protein
MSAVRTGESDDEPEQLRRGSVNKVAGRIWETTRRSLMAVLRLSIGMTGCVIVLEAGRGTHSICLGTNRSYLGDGADEDFGC